MAVCLLAAACGGTVSQGSGAQPDSGVPSDAGVDAASDTCSPATCGADSGTDSGTDGGVVDTGIESGPISFNFPCGPDTADGGTLLCLFPAQFCEESGGGPPPPPDSGPTVGYACNMFPPACQSDPTCACLMANDAFCTGVAGGMVIGCTEDGGAPTIACAFP